jgi:predicted PurR-regulated permease PerM
MVIFFGAVIMIGGGSNLVYISQLLQQKSATNNYIRNAGKRMLTWENGNSSASYANTNNTMPESTVSNSMNILNNLINKLSESPQVGGYVINRISDKDSYYEEYKNYKLKYMALKN